MLDDQLSLVSRYQTTDKETGASTSIEIAAESGNRNRVTMTIDADGKGYLDLEDLKNTDTRQFSFIKISSTPISF